jgi:hypothetical protein
MDVLWFCVHLHALVDYTLHQLATAASQTYWTITQDFWHVLPFFNFGIIIASFQHWGTWPCLQLRLNMSSSVPSAELPRCWSISFVIFLFQLFNCFFQLRIVMSFCMMSCATVFVLVLIW